MICGYIFIQQVHPSIWEYPDYPNHIKNLSKVSKVWSRNTLGHFLLLHHEDLWRPKTYPHSAAGRKSAHLVSQHVPFHHAHAHLQFTWLGWWNAVKTGWKGSPKKVTAADLRKTNRSCGNPHLSIYPKSNISQFGMYRPKGRFSGAFQGHVCFAAQAPLWFELDTLSKRESLWPQIAVVIWNQFLYGYGYTMSHYGDIMV